METQLHKFALLTMSMLVLMTGCKGDIAGQRKPPVSLKVDKTSITKRDKLFLTADVGGNTTITKVEFFDGTSKVGEDITEPFELSSEGFDITEKDNGPHEYSAKAYNHAGNVGDSNVVGVRVCITSPLNARITNLGGNPFVRGDATFGVVVSSGTTEKIERIEVLKNNTLLNSFPEELQYDLQKTHVWKTTQLDEGSYEVRARATRQIRNCEGKMVTDEKLSEPIPITVDWTPPTIKRDDPIPKPGSRNVSVREPMTVVFSEPILAATLNDENLGLAGNSAIAVAYTKTLSPTGCPETSKVSSPDGCTLTMRYISGPSVPNEIRIVLDSDITDRAGNPLEYSTWSWVVPEWYRSSHGQYVSSPKMVVDKDGYPIVAFLNRDQPGKEDSPRTLIVKRWNGTKWITLAPGPSNSVVPSVSPNGGLALALDQNDNPTIAYTEMASSNHIILVKKWDGTSWQPLATKDSKAINFNEIRDAINPTLVIDKTNKLSIAWQEVSTPNYSIYSRSWDGNAWSEAKPYGVGHHPQFYKNSPSTNLAILNGNSLTHTGCDDADDAVDVANIVGQPVILGDTSGSLKILSWATKSGIFVKGRERTTNEREITDGPSNTCSLQDIGTTINKQQPGSSSMGMPDLIESPNDNNLFVVWKEEIERKEILGNDPIFIMRLKRAFNSWDYFGTGVITAFAEEIDPIISLDKNGNPIVAWLDKSSPLQSLTVAWYNAL